MVGYQFQMKREFRNSNNHLFMLKFSTAGTGILMPSGAILKVSELVLVEIG